MKTTIVKRSIVLRGHKTSVSLEDAFWAGVKEIAAERNQTLSELVAGISEKTGSGNLSSALRVTVLEHYKAHAGRRGERHPQPEREVCAVAGRTPALIQSVPVAAQNSITRSGTVRIATMASGESVVGRLFIASSITPAAA